MKPTIGVLTFPINDAGITSLRNVVDVLHPSSGELHLVTGNEGFEFYRNDERVHLHGISHTSGASTLQRAWNYLKTQVKISSFLLKISRKIDIWFFFIGGEKLLLPMISSKLTGTPVVLILAGFTSEWEKSSETTFQYFKFLLTQINLRLADNIVVYSPKLVDDWNLGEFRKKILIVSQHILDFDHYQIITPFEQRQNIIGFVGRFSEEKGIMNLIHAIPSIREKNKNVQFLLIGDGELRDEVEEYIAAHGLGDAVHLTGWIPHRQLPEYLNQCRMIIIPSYTEGLPNLLFEAMACGTIVLASPAGAMPDSIIDGQTGFLMKNNEPETIAWEVERVLNTAHAEKVTANAREFVAARYTFEATVERNKRILQNAGVIS